MRYTLLVVLFLTGPALAQQTPQQIAEAKSNYMARHRLTGHHLMHLGFGGGSFEGSGMSTSPHNVPTCNNGGVCMGDATTRGSDGRYYRVRIFGPGAQRQSYRRGSYRPQRRMVGRRWRR